MFASAPFWFSLWFFFQPVTILIDPGHGGTNLGAQAVDGSWEKTLTLDLALRLEKALNVYPVRTELTRRTDEHLSLWRRTELVRQVRPACFVSLHFNASPLKNRTGVELFFPRADLVKSPGARLTVPVEDSLLAESYLARMQQETWSTGSRNLVRRLAWRLDAAGHRVVQVAPAAFDVITTTDTRALLLEGGFLDHEKEGWKVLDPAYRERLARDLAVTLAALCTEPVGTPVTW
jgi:N-acetylmuramoyl-L-alanine amidase